MLRYSRLTPISATAHVRGLTTWTTRPPFAPMRPTTSASRPSVWDEENTIASLDAATIESKSVTLPYVEAYFVTFRHNAACNVDARFFLNFGEGDAGARLRKSSDDPKTNARCATCRRQTVRDRRRWGFWRGRRQLQPDSERWMSVTSSKNNYPYL